MSFIDLVIKNEYRSPQDDVVCSFYVPCLSNAILYKRAVGFFSSTALVELSKGICKMAESGGHIQLIVSPKLSEDDIIAMKAGYERRSEIVKNALTRDFVDGYEDTFAKERLNLLANLIAQGTLDIHVAYLERGNHIGMYHEKLGIMYDAMGNKVAFSGSMNESEVAFSVNYDSFDVFRGWGETNEASRVANKEEHFDEIWSDREPSLFGYEFKEIKDWIVS